MSEPNEVTGRPDETWTEAQKAWYEEYKAKAIAEMPAEPDWLNEPIFPMEDVMQELDQLFAESDLK